MGRMKLRLIEPQIEMQTIQMKTETWAGRLTRMFCVYVRGLRILFKFKKIPEKNDEYYMNINIIVKKQKER